MMEQCRLLSHLECRCENALFVKGFNLKHGPLRKQRRVARLTTHPQLKALRLPRWANRIELHNVLSSFERLSDILLHPVIEVTSWHKPLIDLILLLMHYFRVHHQALWSTLDMSSRDDLCLFNLLCLMLFKSEWAFLWSQWGIPSRLVQLIHHIIYRLVMVGEITRATIPRLPRV